MAGQKVQTHASKAAGTTSLKLKITLTRPAHKAKMENKLKDDFAQMKGDITIMEILNDGNCLFRAVSDQLYGHQDQHQAIRRAMVTQLRSEPHEYRPYIDFQAHGQSELRRSKRENRNPSYRSAPVPIIRELSEAEKAGVWEAYVRRVSKDREWGDHLELKAIARAYNINIKVHVQTSTESGYLGDIVYGGDEGIDRPVAHVAFHGWRHYSSVRFNAGGHFQALMMPKSSNEAPPVKTHIEAPSVKQSVEPPVVRPSIEVPSVIIIDDDDDDDPSGSQYSASSSDSYRSASESTESSNTSFGPGSLSSKRYIPQGRSRRNITSKQRKLMKNNARIHASGYIDPTIFDGLDNVPIFIEGVSFEDFDYSY
ncbi:hypothetical protein B0O99DRAFT_621026 [Bisporella sp. PMI_857]|nr:hypothetical protein B0O99DRAFT_621026 [Bisporella sp. PMI_857]